MSSDKLEKTKANIAAQYKQALSRAKRNRAAVYPENGVLDGFVRYNLKDYLQDSLGNLAKSFNVKEKWRNFQDTGFNKEDDLNLKEEAQGYLHDNSKLYRNYEGLTPIEAAQKAASKLPLSLAAREYYGISTELHDEGKPTKKYMKNNDFYKLADIHNEETRRLIEKNIIQNMDLDPNDPATYEKIKDIDIVVPKQNSHLYNLVKNSDELAEFVANNYEKLKANPGKRLDDSIIHNKANHAITKNEIKQSKFNLKKTHSIIKNTIDKDNLYTIFNKADVSAKLNPDGSITIWHPDFYDFEHIDLENKNGFDKKIAQINNTALRQQEKKQLANYSLFIPITFSKEEVETILKLQEQK